MRAQITHLPREALIIIVQFICRRMADVYFGSRPNDPSRYDEAVDMWIEDCAARNVLVRSHRVMIRRFAAPRFASRSCQSARFAAWPPWPNIGARL